MFTIVDLAILFTSLLTISFVFIFTSPPRKPIFNVYQRPSKVYWLKVAFMFLVLKLRQVKNKLRRRKLDELQVRAELDRVQKLSEDDQAIDGVFFNAANAQGDHLVVGTARRKNRLIDGFLFLKINASQFGVLESPKLPSTELYQKEDVEEFSAEGLRILPVEPMRKWKLSYEGKMKTRVGNYSLDVSLNCEWTSDLPHFNVDTDMDPLLMAKTMALEPWSRNYFDTLKDIHQTHYEQYGDIKGAVEINGRKHVLNLNCLRDHSFGYKREWRNFHRYGLHFLSVENGDRITVGVISTPISFSNLTMGFVYSAKDGKNFPVQSCDLALHQHGEGGDPPLDYAFSLTANGNTYVVQVRVTDSPHFYISKDWEAKLYERLCTFRVNGLKGWGAAEWQYRNTTGKYAENSAEASFRSIKNTQSHLL